MNQSKVKKKRNKSLVKINVFLFILPIHPTCSHEGLNIRRNSKPAQLPYEKFIRKVALV